MPSDKRKGSSEAAAEALYEKTIRAGAPPTVKPKPAPLLAIERLSSDEGRAELEELKSLLVTFVTICPEGRPLRMWLADTWDKD